MLCLYHQPAIPYIFLQFFFLKKEKKEKKTERKRGRDTRGGPVHDVWMFCFFSPKDGSRLSDRMRAGRGRSVLMDHFFFACGSEERLAAGSVWVGSRFFLFFPKILLFFSALKNDMRLCHVLRWSWRCNRGHVDSFKSLVARHNRQWPSVED